MGEGQMSHNVYRDGKVHVLKRQCKTCIFGTRSPVDIERTQGMKEEADRDNSTIVCHSTLLNEDQDNAACRGYFDQRSSATLRLAESMGVVEFVTLTGTDSERAL